MHELITDQSFDLNRTNEYILSIQVSLDGFSFSVKQAKDNYPLIVSRTPATISSEKFIARRFREWVNTEEILKQSYAEINIQYFTGNFTAIPVSFFLHEKQNEIAALLFKQEVTLQVVTSHPNHSEIKILFSIPVNLSSEIAEKFDSCKLVHPAMVLIEKCSTLFSEINGALLYFTPENFLLLLYNGKNLVLANSYMYGHPNDIVYYLMAALNEFHIKPGSLKLVLSGEISKEDETEIMLMKYFNNLEFWLPETNIDSKAFKNLHRFISLL